MLHYLVLILMGISLVIPVAGQVILLKKIPTRITVALLLVNVANFIMNAAYAFVVNSGAIAEAIVGYKVEVIATSMFIVFMGLFLLQYLQVRHVGVWASLIAIFELFYSAVIILNDPGHFIIVDSEYRFLPTFGIYNLRFEYGPLRLIRYSFDALVLIGTLIYAIVKYNSTSLSRERKNIKRLCFIEISILAVDFIKIFTAATFDFSAFAMAIVVLVMDLIVFKGGFLRVTDIGREWVFNNIDHPFVIVDSTFRFLDCNEEACKVFPELRNYIVGTNVPTDVLRVYTAKEEVIPVGDEDFTRKVMDMIQDDAIVGHAMIMENVTERNRLISRLREERTRADEANRAKSNFVSTISHEIRTPMNAIVGITDIMLRKPRDPEDTDYLMNIKSSGDALLLIINDILDYSKIEAGQMNIVEDQYIPRAMLEDMHMMFVTRLGSKPVELRYDIMEDLPGMLLGDSLRIRQIIINFVNNAIKFTEKGSITLAVKALSETPETIELEFSVTDTGQGIRKDDLQFIFDSFSQVDEKKNHSKEGTGLGLAICKQLAELMGGTIGVESIYGEGSRFFFKIPQKIIDRNPATEIVRVNDEEFDFELPDTHLLLVDDNAMNLKVALGLLEPLKMQIDTAVNGKEAIELVQSKKYDIVFMDHMMPVMDGVEATLNIRDSVDEYFKKLPIVALTANVTEEARGEFKSCGMNAFLAKPIKMKDVCRTLAELLPEEQIVKAEKGSISLSDDQDAVAEAAEKIGAIEGLDVKAGIENCGRADLFLGLLGDFYKYIDSKAAKIEKCMNDHMIKDYTVEVHALKNTSRMIGALELSEEFRHLEELGNAEDEDEIFNLTPGVLERLRGYKTVLEPFAQTANEEKKEVSNSEICDILQRIYDAMDSFDLDGADAALKELMECKLPEGLLQKANELDALIADVAIEDSMALSKEMMDLLS